MTRARSDPPSGANGLAEEISAWASTLIEPYLRRNGTNPYKSPKQLHDPVHKIIELQHWEVFLLDSPLLQRLRFVRQLGVGHLLFPSSGYSRFEHSLGALETATSMFDSVVNVDRLGESAPSPVYGQDRLTARRYVVRLAALLHDLGHCVFSHVSERFYSRTPAVAATVKSLSDFYETKVTPSEALTILIIQSAAFKKLLQASQPRRTEFDEDKMVELVCACIAGSKNKTVPDCFMAEIINGPVDCDKLDYLARDAHMAGVPVPLDIERLLSKLRLARVPHVGQPDLNSLAVVPSGARALDELLVSRIFLFDKFYYHPKVMAAEELLRRALYYLSKVIPAFENPVTLLEFGDDEFLSQTVETFAARYGCRRDDSNLIAALDQIRRAKLRDLPKRAFAFALRYMPEVPDLVSRFETKGRPFPHPQGQHDFRQLTLLLEAPERKEDYAQLIRSYAAELGVQSEIFVGVQSPQRAAGSMYLPVVLPNGAIEEKPSFLFKTSEWTEAYALNKQTSYVFAYSGFPKVHLATERVLSEYGDGELAFAPNCGHMAKLAIEDVDAARKGLPDDWIAYRLPRDYLDRPTTAERLRKQRDRLASHLNSVEPNFGPQLVRAWVSQFPDPDLQDSAISLLEHLTYVEQADVIRGISKLIEKEPNLRKAMWVPLRPRSGLGKSADHLGYVLKEVGLSMRTLGKETAKKIHESGSVVFFDDSLNSGVQSSCLLSSWFKAAPECEHPSDLDSDGQLDEQTMEALKVVQVAFVFYSKHPRGEERLRAACTDVGLKVWDLFGIIDASREECRLAGLKCNSSTSQERFLRHLRDRGKRLLMQKVASGDPVWDEAKAERFSLGYDELDLTLVYQHTISASTPTALWRMATGPVDFWLPIFPRDRDAFRKRVDPSTYSGTKVPEYPT